MLRHALSLFLAASITSCPFVCNLNGALAKVAGAYAAHVLRLLPRRAPGQVGVSGRVRSFAAQTDEMLSVYLWRRDQRYRQCSTRCLGLERMGVSANGLGTALFGDSRSQSSLGC